MKEYSYLFSVEMPPSSTIAINVNGNEINFPTSNGNQFEFRSSGNLDISIRLTGSIGTSAIISVFDEDKKVFRSILRILRGQEAVKRFEVSKTDFLIDRQLEKPRYRETIKFGREPKGIVKTVKEQSVIIPVFYITNRNSEGLDEETGVFEYGEEVSGLKKGIAQVNIPTQRQVGELNRPSFWKLEFSENPNKHFILMSTAELEDDEFLKLISARIGNSSQNDAFCFIHGYNNSFKDCILRTAQIAYDIGFEGAPIAMSWPSLATVMSYWDDEENIKSFSAHIVEFFKFFCKSTSVKKIHIIAHSMGNRALTDALVTLSSDRFFDGFEFNQIILAAPDVDAKVFIDEIVPNLSKCSSRMTLYASSEDNALKVSRQMHNSIIRLGESGEFITCSPGIDTVDASTTDPSLLGHGYFSSTAQLVNDIFQLFQFNTNPINRNLKQMINEETEYWRFR